MNREYTWGKIIHESGRGEDPSLPRERREWNGVHKRTPGNPVCLFERERLPFPVSPLENRDHTLLKDEKV